MFGSVIHSFVEGFGLLSKIAGCINVVISVSLYADVKLGVMRVVFVGGEYVISQLCVAGC